VTVEVKSEQLEKDFAKVNLRRGERKLRLVFGVQLENLRWVAGRSRGIGSVLVWDLRGSSLQDL